MRAERSDQLRLDLRTCEKALPTEVMEEARRLLQQLLREAIDGERNGEEKEDE
jgi:hypothetical protein